jgi:predicted nucleic acid-binding protein
VIHLDANFLIDVLQSEPPRRQVQQWSESGQYINMSSIAWAEFLSGPVTEAETIEARSMIDSIEAFGERDAHVAADLFNQTGQRSRSLPDCMIAALAIRYGAMLATVNSRDFRRFEPFGLKLL